MRKFNYVMISPYMVKRLRHGGENLNFPHQIWSKDYVTGVKLLRNQTYAYQEYLILIFNFISTYCAWNAKNYVE